jgi:hypothetical protein
MVSLVFSLVLSLVRIDVVRLVCGGSSGEDEGDEGDDFDDGEVFFIFFCFVNVMARIDKNNFNTLVRRRTTFGWNGVIASPMKERRATMVTLKLRSV